VNKTVGQAQERGSQGCSVLLDGIIASLVVALNSDERPRIGELRDLLVRIEIGQRYPNPRVHSD